MQKGIVWGLNIIRRKKIEYRQIRSDEKKMMTLLMVVMMVMMLMTMMMTIVAHTYTDWQVGASCVERELPPEATCHLVPCGKKANWTEKAWFRQILGGFMRDDDHHNPEAAGICERNGEAHWWQFENAIRLRLIRHRPGWEGPDVGAFSQKHTLLLLLNVPSRYTCGRT